MTKKSELFENGQLSKTQVQELVKAGAIRQDFLQVAKGFNSEYSVVDVDFNTVTSFRTGEDVDMPVVTLSNDGGPVTVYGSTLFNALVITDEIKTKKIKKADGLPVFFRDDFDNDHSGLRTVAKYLDDDGGFCFRAKYSIEGAIVTRSTIDDKRWALGYRAYIKGALFLEFEKQYLGNNKLRWITEDRIHEIASLPEADRTFEVKGRKVVLPGKSELKTLPGAETDPRYASAQFLIKQW